MASDKSLKRDGHPKILGWRGIMGPGKRMFRIMVIVMLAVAGVALTYTQLGFVGVELPGRAVGYIVVLLLVVALAALLLGSLGGAGIGLVTGVALFYHAKTLPLDHYEYSFITPMTSIVMFTVTGFLLGLLFAIALRKDPPQARRVIYLSLICLLVSHVYSTGFAFNVIFSLTFHTYSEFGSGLSTAELQSNLNEAAMQLGDAAVQALGTGLVMAVLTIAADYLVRKLLARKGAPGLRTVFSSWLAVVVTLAFMTISAVSFAVTSMDELWDASVNMKNDVNYLCSQIQCSDNRSRSISEFTERARIDYAQLSGEAIDSLVEGMSQNTLLDGYDVSEHGTVVVALDGWVYAANNKGISQTQTIEDALGDEVVSAIERSIDEGDIVRFVYGVSQWAGDDASSTPLGTKPGLAYLCADKVRIDDGQSGAYEYEVAVIQTSDMVFAKRPAILTWMALSSFALLATVFAIVFQLLNRVVARRIDEENAALAQITDGNLDARAKAAGTREFESLSNGINTTVDAMKGWIAEAESRMDSELATAKAIQEAALPRTFPPYPDILKFDIYASMNAAKQVGGDFYDFFLVGDECGPVTGNLAFIVADVSGKGVPAALFMMKAKALLRDYVTSGMELGEAVGEANRQLCDGNDAGMFVTAWVGLLDYENGLVTYVNAGHNPPLLWQRDAGWQWLRTTSGLPLGLFELPYDAHELQCETGDMLLLYSDGVTEALDVDGNLYGEDRLLAVANKGHAKRSRELLEDVRADVASFAAGAEQSDDITVLTLEVGVPPEVTATLEVSADVKQLDRVNAFLPSELNARLCPQRVQSQLDIAVEELFVNVCHYAYPEATPDNPGTVRIRRTYSAEPASITVDIVDDGVAYNPLAKPDAVTPDDIADVPIGGLGILMAKKCTDEMAYERVGESNVVTIVKRW